MIEELELMQIEMIQALIQLRNHVSAISGPVAANWLEIIDKCLAKEFGTLESYLKEK